MRRFLFGGLLNRAMIPTEVDDVFAGNDVGTYTVNAGASTGGAAVAQVAPPVDNISTINPAALNAVDQFGNVIPDVGRWEVNPRRYVMNSSGALFADLIDLMQEQHDYQLTDENARAAVYAQNPAAARTIDALGLRNWVIVQSDAQSFMEPLAPAPSAPVVPSQEEIRIPSTGTAVYPWTPQAGGADGGGTYYAPTIPEAPIPVQTTPAAPVTSAPVVGLPSGPVTAPGVSVLRARVIRSSKNPRSTLNLVSATIPS